jgi:predicted O-linked N-acetylglucosamine transferase (SPINDLY family)
MQQRVSTMDLSELVRFAGELQSTQRQKSAIQLYKDWLKTPRPMAHVARFNLAVLLTDSGRPDEAEKHLRKAIEESPRFCPAYFNLGMAVERQGRPDEALLLWLNITSIANRDNPEELALVIAALNQIGRLQETLKNYPQAESALFQSLSLDPKQPDALQHWIHLRQKQCKWPVYQEFGEVRHYDMLTATSPLAMLALTDDPLRQLISSQSFVARKFNFPVTKHGPKPYKHKKIRLGYVSGDLCTHAVGLLLPDFLEHHNREEFELYAFDYSLEDGTTTRERIKAAFDHFFDIRPMSDAHVAAKVRELEIDVLIDMHGLSSGCRPEIFTSRPAVLQMTWLGFIGTTAFPWLDYVIADDYVLPPSLQPVFSERLLSLPYSFLPMSVQNINPQVLEANFDATARAEGPIRLASFNNIYKIKPDLLKAWADVLNQTPGQSELWLLDDNEEATKQVKQFLVSIGADISRITFLPRVSYKEHHERLKKVDLFLDTYPYNGGSTARDVVAQAIPFVTLSGLTMVSRMGGSLLKEVGLEEMITHDYASYTAQAVRFVQDSGLRQQCRQRLVSYLQRAQSFNALKVRVLEQKLQSLLA